MKYIDSYQMAETNAALYLRKLGYADATVSPDGTDGGIDVMSFLAVAQVKWRGAQVSRPDVQRLFGARGHHQQKAMFFFCASGYSQHAIEYADQVGMGLYVYDPDGKVTPINRIASQATTQRLPFVAVSGGVPQTDREMRIEQFHKETLIDNDAFEMRQAATRADRESQRVAATTIGIPEKSSYDMELEPYAWRPTWQPSATTESTMLRNSSTAAHLTQSHLDRARNHTRSRSDFWLRAASYALLAYAAVTLALNRSLPPLTPGLTTITAFLLGTLVLVIIKSRRDRRRREYLSLVGADRIAPEQELGGTTPG